MGRLDQVSTSVPAVVPSVVLSGVLQEGIVLSFSVAATDSGMVVGINSSIWKELHITHTNDTADEIAL